MNSSWLDKTSTTNHEFAEFVTANADYVTDSERYGWSFVFEAMLSEDQLELISQVRGLLLQESFEIYYVNSTLEDFIIVGLQN